MSKIDKIIKLSTLFDLYKELLTELQKEIFIKYYLEDFSLSEIAKIKNTSRTSVSDNLKKAEIKLIIFEEKLKIDKRNRDLEKIILKIENKKLKKDLLNKLNNE